MSEIPNPSLKDIIRGIFQASVATDLAAGVFIIGFSSDPQIEKLLGLGIGLFGVALLGMGIEYAFWSSNKNL